MATSGSGLYPPSVETQVERKCFRSVAAAAIVVVVVVVVELVIVGDI